MPPEKTVTGPGVEITDMGGKTVFRNRIQAAIRHSMI
jgi:hypothetical protein